MQLISPPIRVDDLVNSRAAVTQRLEEFVFRDRIKLSDIEPFPWGFCLRPSLSSRFEQWWVTQNISRYLWIEATELDAFGTLALLSRDRSCPCTAICSWRDLALAADYLRLNRIGPVLWNTHKTELLGVVLGEVTPKFNLQQRPLNSVGLPSYSNTEWGVLIQLERDQASSLLEYFCLEPPSDWDLPILTKLGGNVSCVLAATSEVLRVGLCWNGCEEAVIRRTSRLVALYPPIPARKELLKRKKRRVPARRLRPFFMVRSANFSHTSTADAIGLDFDLGIRIWLRYIDTLTWADGQLDHSGWLAACRAASLGVIQRYAIAEIKTRIKTATEGRCRLHKIDQQFQRAYLKFAPSNGCHFAPPSDEIDNLDTASSPTPEEGWPKPNFKLIEYRVRHGIGLHDLWESSPVRFNSDCVHTEDIIDSLFPGNPWLCCAGQKQSQFATHRRQSWRGKLSELAFIVPSPMTAKYGLTALGRRSQHSLAATGPRHYLIVELDFKRFNKRRQPTPWTKLIDQWVKDDISVDDASSAILWRLAEFAPLVLVVHSGNVSLHGWYRAISGDERTWKEFFRYAIELGADPVSWTPSQFVRMPDGLRETLRPVRQQTFFFEPSNAVEADPTTPPLAPKEVDP